MGQTAPGSLSDPALTLGPVTMWGNRSVLCLQWGGLSRPRMVCEPQRTEAQGSGQTANELGLVWGIVRGSRSAGLLRREGGLALVPGEDQWRMGE